MQQLARHAAVMHVLRVNGVVGGEAAAPFYEFLKREAYNTFLIVEHCEA